MHISVTEAKARLNELMRRAEAGKEVVLTRHGHPVVRLVAVNAERKKTIDRRAILEAARAASAASATSGPTAARSQDFLYGSDGMPGR